MSKTESWKTWLPVIAALIVFGMLAALWPTISSGLGGGASRAPNPRIPFEPQPVVLDIPEVLLPNGTAVGGQTITMESWQAVLGLTAVTIALIVGTGLFLGILNTVLSRLVVKTTVSDSYQENLSSLEIKEKAKLKEKRTGREASPPREDISMPRWSLISNTLIGLMFVFFTGVALVTTFYPERVVVIGGELVNPTLLIVGIPLIITLTLFVFAPRWGTAVLALIVLFFIALASFGALNLASSSFGWDLTISAMISLVGLVQIITIFILASRWHSPSSADFEKKVAHADEKGREKGIPYDAIVVLFTGLLIVGLGIGFMVLINSPYWAQIEQLMGQ